MTSLKIGLFVEGLRIGVENGVRRVAELGLPGFQMFTTQGKLTPETLSPAGRRRFRNFVTSCGLEISATCFHDRGLDDPEQNPLTLEKLRTNIDLAHDLEVGIITAHIGAVPEDREGRAWGAMRAALSEIAPYLEARGVVLAAETGPESVAVLRQFLDELNSPSVAVNLDPANLLMAGFDLFEAVEELAPRIVHTHAKDARRGCGEVALGDGEVDFPRLVAALQRQGYQGYYTIERESGDDPERDIRGAIEVFRALSCAPCGDGGAGR